MSLLFPFLLVEGAATVVTSLLLLAIALRTSQKTTDGPLALGARGLACFVVALAIAGSLFVRFTTQDWMHFQWSLGFPLIAVFCVSGAFLPWMWPAEHAGENALARTASEWTRSGWWFPAAALVLGLSSLVFQLLLPGSVPAARNSPGPFVGTFELAAHGLGLGELPSVLQVRFEHDAKRGMDHLTRDLTVPLSVLTLAAELLCAYVALAFGLRFARFEPVRYALCLVAPMAVTAALSQRWFRLARGLWQEAPSEIRAFGPTLLAATLVLAVLLIAWLRDHARARSACRD